MPAPRIIPEAQSVGRRLAQFRASLGLTQKQIADRLHMSVVGYSNKETGRAGLSATDIGRFAKAMGVTPLKLAAALGLLDDDDEPHRDAEPLDEWEEQELARLMAQPGLRVHFATIAKSYEEFDDEDRRALLEALQSVAKISGFKRERGKG